MFSPGGRLLASYVKKKSKINVSLKQDVDTYIGCETSRIPHFVDIRLT
jgi:hypothetical protein